MDEVLASHPAPARLERLALRFVQIGALAVVVAVSTQRLFELDRFLVPKELALHLTAVVAGLFAMRAIRRLAMTWLDLVLLIHLAISFFSALAATNPWLGLRGLAVSASALAMFWIGRGLRESGLSRPLLNAIALAVVLASVTSLLQAYGVHLDVFSLNRAPGGTLGNRNFVGHCAAFGLPVLLLVALQAKRRSGFLVASIGTAITLGTLVLTRSRAAWIAAAAVLAIFAGAMLVSRAMRRDGRTWRRIAFLAVGAAAGLAAVLLLPNTLRWRSENPYLESVRGVAGYNEGSGRGRLVQYQRSLRMAVAHPLLGVGPGNWPVVYPKHAPADDPSLNESEPGTTFNPWPSSDWIAFAAERGPFAAMLMALVFAAIAFGAIRRIVGAATVDDALAATALLGTVVAAGLAGLFDAVLLLGLPALLVWTAIGALWSPARAMLPMRAFVVVAALSLSTLGAARSTAQLVAMEIFATSSDRDSLARAAALDPGNYRLQLRLARTGRRDERCAHAKKALSLYPNAHAAKSLARPCK